MPMTGATEVLVSGTATNRQFIVRGGSGPVVFYARSRGSRTYDVDARVSDPGASTEAWATVVDNNNTAFASETDVARGVIHRVNGSAAGTVVFVAGRDEPIEVDLGPYIGVTTARSLSVGAGDTAEQATLKDDFRLPRANENLAQGAGSRYRWSASSSAANRATVTVDPATGVLQVTGVSAGSSTITLAVMDEDSMRITKNLSVTVS